MIRRTRIKIVAITVSIIALVEIAMIGFALSVLYGNERRDAIAFVSRIVDSAKVIKMPDDGIGVIVEGTSLEKDDKIENMKTFVSAYYNDGSDVEKQIVQSSAAFGEDEMKAITLTVVSDKEDGAGRIESYFYARKTYTDLDVPVVVAAVIDKTSELRTLSGFVLRGATVALVGTICLAFVVWCVSYYVTKPLKESIDNEKRFISDASHELKTPLTIISANAEVMSDGNPSEWTDNIKFQTKRMQKLVEEMLTLSRLDENSTMRRKVKHERFSLSDDTLEVVMPFDPIAYEQHIEFNYDIEPDAVIYSDSDDYKKVLGVLVENAVKYTDGKIDLSLKKKNKNSYVLSVYNTGCGIKNEDKVRVFERFYRSDASRAGSTGGSGLGLSIAKELSEKNGWKLSLDCEENVYTEFKLILKTE